MKDRFLFLIAALFFFVLALPVLAQAPIHATPCDLVNNPGKYANQVVEVRGSVSISFEDFTLVEPGCEEASRPIWLIYGGDEPTPTASTVNDLSRKPGSVLKVNGRPIPLVHDAALDLFRQRLGAIRISPVGDRPCYDCHLYQVTATLTGVFFAAQSQGQQFEGYGHLGCCHLLAIQQVSDVGAERTPIPMGGIFECAAETRKLDAIEANRFRTFESCAGLNDTQCRNLVYQEIAAAAAYWNDHIDPREWTSNLGEIAGNTSKHTWESVDKLKTYTVSIQSSDPEKAGSMVTGGDITRSTCKATAPPLPQSTIISCRNLWSEFPVQKAEVEKLPARISQGLEKWRMSPAADASREALKQAAGVWGIALSKDYLPAVCNRPMDYNGDEFSWCQLTARDGMQSLGIQITRFAYLRHGRSWDQVPWVLTRGNGVVCRSEP